MNGTRVVHRQKNLGGTVVIEGKADAEVFNEPGMQVLIGPEFRRTFHRWCNWGIKHPETGELHHHRARVKELQAEGLLVDVDGEDKPIAVKFTDVTQRLKLPWKPEALYDYFIVFRRRDGEKNEYIEDLRVRKNS